MNQRQVLGSGKNGLHSPCGQSLCKTPLTNIGPRLHPAGWNTANRPLAGGVLSSPARSASKDSSRQEAARGLPEAALRWGGSPAPRERSIRPKDDDQGSVS